MSTSKDKHEYIASLIIVTVYICIKYRYSFFASIPGLSDDISNGVFYGIVLISTAVSFLLILKGIVSNQLIIVYIATPWILYSALMFSGWDGIPLVIKISLLCGGYYFITSLLIEPKAFIEKLGTIVGSSLVIVALCIIISLPAIGVKNCMLNLNATEETTYTIEHQKENLILLSPANWEAADTDKKLEVLQIVAKIESNHLNLPYLVNLDSRQLPEDIRGEYNDILKTATINTRFLETASSDEAVRTVCHEVYHSYQRRLVDIYKDAPKKLRGTLEYATDAGTYKKEMERYEEKNYDLYFNQLVEVSARSYAADATEEYITRVNYYMTHETTIIPEN